MKRHERTLAGAAVLLSLAGMLSASCASNPETKPVAPAPAAATASTTTATAAEAAAPPAEAKPVNPAIERLLAQAKPDEDAPRMNPMTDDPLAASWVDYKPQPPDGKWLVDLDGREYFVLPVPKQEGYYVRLGPNQVRLTSGFPIVLEREDESYFYAKIFKLDTLDDPEPKADAPKAPTKEELEELAKSYKVSTPPSDELSFVAVGAGLPSKGQWRNGFAIADVDGDGELDLVHGPPRRSLGGTPSIFRGDGKGGFTKWKEAKFPPNPYDYGDAAAGDFNGDGKIDLAFGIHLRGIVAMLGDGKGNFTSFSEGLDLSDPAVTTWSANPFTSRAIEVIDWNRDGRDDILALSEGPARAGAATTVYQPGKRIYLAGPKGWSLAKGSDAADSTVGDTIALGDFNADGKTDFITGVSLAGGKSLLNIAESDTKWTVSAVQSLRQGALVRGVAAADLNGDRRDDMFVSWINTEYGVVRSGIDLLLSMPGGWSLIGLWSFEGRLAVRALGIGDLNADGNHDVVGFTDDAQPVVLLGHGKGKFTLESPDGIDSESIGCAGYHVELVDLDHDGRDEILVGFAGERCSGQGSLRAWKAGPRQQK